MLKANLKNKLNDNPIFKIISEVAAKDNVLAFVIGGYVRDLIMKRGSKDVDIVVLGSGIDLATNVAKKISSNTRINVFANFGTAMIMTDDWQIEFVGARKESYRRDSRKPIVENGTMEDDLYRRDFSINAMAISLNKEDYGNLYDEFDGIEDIKNKIIRTPQNPEVTFSDDPLRMMRAIRFATQLNFKIESTAYDAIILNKERIKIISQERITEELNKIIMANRPSVGFNYLDETGLLQLIFKDLAKLKGIESVQGKKHKDNFYHTLEVLDNVAIESDNIWLRWAALLHDIGKSRTKKFEPNIGWTFHGHDFIGSKMVKDIFQRLKLPLNEKMVYVEKLVALHLRPITLSEEDVTDSAIRRILFDAGDEIEDLMLLCEADITSKNILKKERFLGYFQLVRQKLKEIEEKDKIRNFQPPISGEEIMGVLNILPGKAVGILKNALKDAILDGIIPNDHDAAYKYMIELAKKNGISVNVKK